MREKRGERKKFFRLVFIFSGWGGGEVARGRIKTHSPNVGDDIIDIGPLAGALSDAVEQRGGQDVDLARPLSYF